MRTRFPTGQLLAALLAAACSHGCARNPPQTTFATPEAAVDGLVQSLRNGDKDRLSKILGEKADEIVYSGDEVADKQAAEKFLSAYDEKHSLTPENGAMTLLVGKKDWPFPIPIAKDEQKNDWAFDTEAGKEEILNRRVGRNELSAVQVCLAIVDAQREYAGGAGAGKDGVNEYAQKFFSDAGKRNGLYWPTAEGEEQSPLGELAADATAEGYTHTEGSGPRPYHGYMYRILTSQGPAAPGGEMDYMVKGRLIGGFGVVAYPARYGTSGVMTFIVSHNGMVYQRDLGNDTEGIARRMIAFNPEPGWTKADTEVSEGAEQ